MLSVGAIVKRTRGWYEAGAAAWRTPLYFSSSVTFTSRSPGRNGGSSPRATSHDRTSSALSLQISALSPVRSEEHTSELQSLMRISYAVFCLNNKNTPPISTTDNYYTYYHTSHPNFSLDFVTTH